MRPPRAPRPLAVALTFSSYGFPGSGKLLRALTMRPRGSRCAVRGIKQRCWHHSPHAALVLVGLKEHVGRQPTVLVSQAASSSHSISLDSDCRVSSKSFTLSVVCVFPFYFI